MKNKTVPLAQAHALSIKEVGGKAQPLGLLAAHRLNIPKGFVIPSSVLSALQRAGGQDRPIRHILAQLRSTKMKNLDDASKELRSILENIYIRHDIDSAIYRSFSKLNVKYVSVRSSAVCEDQKKHSWAGEFETYTWVNRRNLIQRIKQCWSSLYTPRALMYAHNQELAFAVDMAVIVQEMIDSEVSGVCFTKEPNDPDSDLLIIEAARGLGELLVGGDITPDRYWVDKKEKIITDIEVFPQTKAVVCIEGKQRQIRIAKKDQMMQKLTGKEIVAVANKALKIESMRRCPQDIEWAISSRKLYILQTRPISAYNFD